MCVYNEKKLLTRNNKIMPENKWKMLAIYFVIYSKMITNIKKSEKNKIKEFVYLTNCLEAINSKKNNKNNKNIIK